MHNSSFLCIGRSFHDHVFIQSRRRASKCVGPQPFHRRVRPPTIRRAPGLRRTGRGRYSGAVRSDRLDSAGDRRTDRPERSAVTSQYESRRPAVLRAALGVPYVRGTVLLTGVHVHLRHGGRALPPPEPRADSSVGYSAVGTDSGLSFGHHHHLDGAVPRLDAGRGGRVDFRNLHQSGLEHGVLVHPVPDQRTN